MGILNIDWTQILVPSLLFSDKTLGIANINHTKAGMNVTVPVHIGFYFFYIVPNIFSVTFYVHKLLLGTCPSLLQT